MIWRVLMPTIRIIKCNLKELLTARGLDQKTLHKISKVREATIGEMVRDTNKTFTRDNINSIIKALDIKNINEFLSIVDEKE